MARPECDRPSTTSATTASSCSVIGHPLRAPSRARSARGPSWSSLQPHHPAYQNNAIVVGGGTRVFGAQAWRFHPDDFRMASLYGVPEGSALADWPIGYDDLAPFYDRVEWDLGVAGEATTLPAANPLPHPPFPLSPEGALLVAAARLGWSTARVPLLINTESRDDRPACVRCGFCVGFPCPVDAKNGSDVTVLPQALPRVPTSSRCPGHPDRRRRDVDSSWPARQARSAPAASLWPAAPSRPPACSRSAELGNDWVGDCLQGHTYAGAFGRF